MRELSILIFEFIDQELFNVFLIEVLISIGIHYSEGILNAEVWILDPVFYLFDDLFCPIKLLELGLFLFAIHDTDKTFVVDHLDFGSVHVFKEIFFLLLGQSYYVSNIFHPFVETDKAIVIFVKLFEKIKETYLLFDGFLSDFDYEVFKIHFTSLDCVDKLVLFSFPDFLSESSNVLFRNLVIFVDIHFGN
mgnify:CR=1 FL=1